MRSISRETEKSKKKTLTAIELFFLKMQAIYPYRWSGQFDGEHAQAIAKGEWQAMLAEISAEQIERGLKRCRNEGRDFPPAIPEFRRMCFLTAKDLGVLSEVNAYQAFLRKDFSDPVVKMLQHKIDRYHWGICNVQESQRIFKTAYEEVCDEYLTKINQQKLINFSAADGS